MKKIQKLLKRLQKKIGEAIVALVPGRAICFITRKHKRGVRVSVADGKITTRCPRCWRTVVRKEVKEVKTAAKEGGAP